MGKLRNASTEIGMFTQWLGRKCRNHNPLEELGLRKESFKRMYKAKGQGNVTVMNEEPSTLVYEAGGRAFVIRVTEVDPNEVEAVPRTAVGY